MFLATRTQTSLLARSLFAVNSRSAVIEDTLPDLFAGFHLSLVRRSPKCASAERCSVSPSSSIAGIVLSSAAFVADTVS